MNINSLNGNTTTTPTSEVGAVRTSGPQSSIPPAMGAAATATVSTAGQFFSELQELSQSDPTRFKAVAAQLATSFQNDASQASGPQARLLTKLAQQFNQAAESGTLQPPQGPSAPSAGAAAGQGAHGHHHHHGGGGGWSGGQSGEVETALQNAMNILTQALQASPGTTAPASTSSSTST